MRFFAIALVSFALLAQTPQPAMEECGPSDDVSVKPAPKPKKMTHRQELQREYSRKRLARHKSLGLCAQCSEPAVSGRSKCQKHLDSARDRHRRTGPKRLVAYREAVFRHYGTRCACCGEVRSEFLQIDHVDGGGNRHLKQVRQMYRWLYTHNFPPGFQTLCANCNWAKGRFGICPHRREVETIPTCHIMHSAADDVPPKARRLK